MGSLIVCLVIMYFCLQVLFYKLMGIYLSNSTSFHIEIARLVAWLVNAVSMDAII